MAGRSTRGNSGIAPRWMAWPRRSPSSPTSRWGRCSCGSRVGKLESTHYKRKGGGGDLAWLGFRGCFRRGCRDGGGIPDLAGPRLVARITQPGPGGGPGKDAPLPRLPPRGEGRFRGCRRRDGRIPAPAWGRRMPHFCPGGGRSSLPSRGRVREGGASGRVAVVERGGTPPFLAFPREGQGGSAAAVRE